MQKTPISSIKVGNTGDVTPKQILEEANLIWSEAKQIWKVNRLSMDHTEQLRKIYNDFYSLHRDLFIAYPTVMSHMLHDMAYSPHAFEKYLKRLLVRPWTNDEQRLDSYADYTVMLYKALNPKYDPKYVANLRADCRKRLQQTHDDIQKRFEKNRNDVDREEKQLDASRREELRKLTAQLAQSLDVDVSKLDDKQLVAVHEVLTEDKKREVDKFPSGDV